MQVNISIDEILPQDPEILPKREADKIKFT